MDRGTWWAIVHGVAKSRTRLSDFTFTFKHIIVQDSKSGAGLPWYLRGYKRLPAMEETQVRSLGWEDPLETEMATHYAGESHGWRSLVGYSPRGRKESDTTERLHLHLFEGPVSKYSHILQYCMLRVQCINLGAGTQFNP